MREWWNRHVSRADRPEGVTWDDLRPRCPLCGFTCMGALNFEDYLYILQDHYSVCIGVPMSLEVTAEQFARNSDPDFCYYCQGSGFNPGRTDEGKRAHLETCEKYWRNGGCDLQLRVVEGWGFSSRTFLQFKWNPYQPRTIWVMVPRDDGHYVMLHGFSVLEEEYKRGKYDGWPTKDEAIAASKKYVVAWERSAEYLNCELINEERIRYVVGRAYSGETLVRHSTPDGYYLHRREVVTANAGQTALLKQRAELLASMFENFPADKALTRLSIMAGELPEVGWESVIHDAFLVLSQKMMAAENSGKGDPPVSEPQAPPVPEGVQHPGTPGVGSLFG